MLIQKPKCFALKKAANIGYCATHASQQLTHIMLIVFVSISDMLKYGPSKETQIKFERKQFADELRQGTEKVAQICNQTNIDIETLGSLMKTTHSFSPVDNAVHDYQSIVSSFDDSGSKVRDIVNSQADGECCLRLVKSIARNST